WNWTSALEVGIRLIQFTWIDALLTPARSEGLSARLAALRRRVLPAHAYYAWRHRSFGSSANNHLLGELVGLVLAVARWPELASVSAPLEELQGLWERETLAQFAPDGGNREQALNYQLFSFEFAWQAHQAILASKRVVPPRVHSRLADAARFFWEAQVEQEPWDYGDSDSAYVTPLFADPLRIVQEWRGWIADRVPGASIAYWLGAPPTTGRPVSAGDAPMHTASIKDWWLYPQSGIAMMASGFWWMRWDLSRLGYLATAAHGHLDALHLSIWHRGVAMVVDPGTGAYYADTSLRTWLASRAAHNAPCPEGTPEWPRRLGPFLWASHHEPPAMVSEGSGVEGRLSLRGHALTRRITPDETRSSWRVEDRCVGQGGAPAAFAVRWQFAPGATLRMLDERQFVLCRRGESLTICVSESWDEVRLVELGDALPEGEPRLAGIVSPSFRKTERAPYLILKARPSRDKTCVFTTTFLASPPS
ncbi:MAG: heparinase II/III-family protein, partial [Verrucomicrobia bacterium]|nr:heparinase II/III-family protein [Verrucomicrobiota bacterium]